MSALAATAVELDGRSLSLETIEAVALRGAHVSVSADARARVAAARACVERHFEAGAVIYGVTTGFGRMANVVIDGADAAQLQRNLVRSHAAGTGAPLREEFVRAAGLLRVSSLAAGHSGIKPETLDLLVEILNRGVTPVVPCQGSVGASGDLAPLAHMTLTLIGEGEATYRGERLPSAVALARAGLAPLELGAKEGLSLINGTEVMTGIATLSLLRAERLLVAADIVGALSLEAFLATDAVFDRRINALRPHPGSIAVADHLRALLARSEIMQSHRDCGRVQDPYSFRCIPVVHGAARDAAAHARAVLEIEAVSVTDNPLIFPDDDDFLTGGNFHGQPVGVVCDFVKAVMVEVASMSERRSYLLLNGEERGLPLFLSRKPGLESGLMIVQYAAAALVSESKALAAPSSVDSIPTSAGQEDHVSMATIAARTFDRILDNVEGALACELLCALAATDFRRPLRSGAGTGAAYEAARATIAPLDGDRVPAPDIESARALLASNALARAASAALQDLTGR
jgi:histidine ammonia-lyase